MTFENESERICHQMFAIFLYIFFFSFSLLCAGAAEGQSGHSRDQRNSYVVSTRLTSSGMELSAAPQNNTVSAGTDGLKTHCCGYDFIL